MDFSQITNSLKNSFCDKNYFNTGIILDEMKIVKEISKGYELEAKLIKSETINDQYKSLSITYQNGIEWIKIEDVIQLVISSYHDSAIAGHWSNQLQCLFMRHR
ncbi:hypothetical protein ACTFIT_012386 [Dictyostelium discoideum]